MPDEPLSQKEIDALLAAAGGPLREEEPASQSHRVSTPAAQPFRQAPADLDLGPWLLDMDVDLAVVFGENEMKIADVLGLVPGAVVELDRMLDEPVELRLAGRTVALAEVVTVEGDYAIRITENLLRTPR